MNLRCFVILAALAASLTSFAKAKPERVPPAVSIQESKFEDNRPAEEKRRFNNLKPMIEMVKAELFNAGFEVKDERDEFFSFEEHGKSQATGGMEGGLASNWKVDHPAFYIRLSVSMYGFSSVSAVNALSGNTTERKSLAAKMHATIVDARTAKMVGSAPVNVGPLSIDSLKGQLNSKNGNFDEQLLQNLNEQCAHQIVRKFMEKIPKKFLPDVATGKVLKAADYGVLVKINPEKVKEGDILDVFRLESLDDDDEDGDDEDEDDEELVEEIYVGSVAVSEIKEKYVVCTPMPESKNAKFAKKQLVRPSSRYRGKQPARPAAHPDDPF